MKRMILMIAIMAGISSAAIAADLREFYVDYPFLSSYTAGQSIGVTLRAIDVTGAYKTDYTGNLTVTAATGDVVVTETGTNITPSFVAGECRFFMKILGADASNVVMMTDATGSTHTFTSNVSPDTFSKMLILTQGQTYAPGTVSGYTGQAVTLTTGQEFYLTGTAVDAYNNPITSFAGSSVGFYSTGSYSVVPDFASKVDLNSVSGSAVWAMTINDSLATQYALKYEVASPYIAGQEFRYFTSNNNFYMWADVNGVTWTAEEVAVNAGAPYSVSVTVSHLPRSEEAVPTDDVRTDIQHFMNFVNYSSGLLVEPYSITITAVDGNALFSVTQTTRVDRIIIRPVYGNIPTDVTATAIDSIPVQIYAGAPVSISITSDKNQIGAGESAQIITEVFDSYGNKVSGTAVDYQILFSGEGSLASSQVVTDDYNYASNYSGGRSINTYTAADVPGTSVTIQASVAGVGTAAVQLELVSASGVGQKDVVKNTPNPFNPSKGPTKIAYYLDEDSSVTMKLYNMFGRLVWSEEASKGSEFGTKGPQEYSWDGTTNGGFTVGVGLYVLNITVKNSSEEYTLKRKIAVKK